MSMVHLIASGPGAYFRHGDLAIITAGITILATDSNQLMDVIAVVAITDEWLVR